MKKNLIKVIKFLFFGAYTICKGSVFNRFQISIYLLGMNLLLMLLPFGFLYLEELARSPDFYKVLIAVFATIFEIIINKLIKKALLYNTTLEAILQEYNEFKSKKIATTIVATITISSLYLPVISLALYYINLVH